MPTYQILHVIHSGAIGGGPRILNALATHFNQAPWQSQVICSNDGPLGEDLKALHIPVHYLELSRLGQNFSSWIPLTRKIQALKPDILHIHGQFAGLFGGMAGKFARVPAIIYTSQFPSFITDWDMGRVIRNDIAERTTCWCADKVICVSKTDYHEYSRRKMAISEKLAVINNGADISSFKGPFDRQATRQECNLPLDAPVVGFFGRLTDQKGVEFLLRAVPMVLSQHSSCHFLIVGDGPKRQELEQIVRQLTISAQVTFLGMRRDIPALMNAVDIVAIPSLFEPNALCTFEAMAAGRAVVASAVEGLPEQVVDGVTGHLVKPADSSSLAAKLNELLATPSVIIQMGLEGRRRAESNFSFDIMFAKYEEVYRQLIPHQTVAQAS
jgi:glycosyltransferase involved in cell wall biosynthesis